MPDPELDRARKLAHLMDDYFLDPILGFILPGVGDLVGSLIGVYIILIGARRKVSPVILARMVMNLAIDTAVGVIPVVGDAADIAFKANDKNLALLTARNATGGKATLHDWGVLAGAALAFVAIVGVVVYVMARVIHWLF